ncbi:MAG: tetratricopeptide repeat protein [Burkholderiales bacterium]
MSVQSGIVLRQALQAAAYALQRGDAAEAERCCRAALDADAASFDALNLLGILAARTGRMQEAAGLFARAVSANPRSAETFSNLGATLSALNRHEEALASCDRAVALRSGFAEAHFNRGVALTGLGRHADALASYDRAVGLRADDARFHNNRGNALRSLGRDADALAAFERALALQPGFADAHINRGTALRALGHHAEALASYERALALDPGSAGAHNNLGATLEALRRFDAALASYDRAIALQPGYADAHFNRGNALRGLRRLHEALASYERALELRPDFAAAWHASGDVMRDLFRPEAALAAYERAMQVAPGYADVLHACANTLRELKRFDDALACYDKAMDACPDRDYLRGDRLHTRMLVCDWAGLDAELAATIAGVASGQRPMAPGIAVGVSGDPALQLRLAQMWIGDKCANIPAPAAWPEHPAHDRIRVGYFSADFRDHATMHLMAELFERHDRTRFEIVAVSFGPPGDDDVRKRVAAAFDRFVDVGDRSDGAVAELSRELGIDIAVDLKGFTQDNRLPIFAQRAAPIQVNYLGYPGTMGAAFIDYLVADETLVPDEDRGHYAERIVLLPDSYQANDSRRVISDREFTRDELGLPAIGFVYCCFNANYKTTPEIFDSWMRILTRVDGSVLWLLEDNALAARNLRAAAEARGVDARRLVFAPRMPLAEHLARHRAADLFLDTLPCNAHTTASDALWAGLPVLTRPGRTFAGRVGASLVRAAGLPELVVESAAQYEQRAVELATHRDELDALRGRLAASRRTVPLFDAARFARHLESAYERMYERHLGGEAPDHFRVTADG